ncbi:TNF receptor-associated factor 3-like isoform X1 [Amblyomma americanum]
MPPASRQYTLVGFAPELDWRPLTFLKPIPASRVCSACGLVRKRTALLPCMHVLCECCFQHCGQDGLNECPLDGNHYEKKDVALFHCTADDLLKREVNCWNEGSGCEYATTASRISQHFLLECEHHSVRCPKCSATVLCRDVCTHLRWGSCNSSRPVASECQVPVSQVDEAASSLRGTFEGQGGEITAYPRPIAVDTSTNGDRLSEISHGINTLKETLRQELTSLKELNHEEITSSNAEVKQCLASCTDTVNTCLRRIKMVENKLNNKLGATGIDLSQIAASIEQVKAELKERDQKSLQPVTGARRVSALQLTHCEFFVRGAKSLQQEALKNGRAEYDSERVYLRGYCMSPGVRFMSDSTSLLLFVKYTLHKGDMDDDIQWPFKHKIRVSLMHPSGRGERVPVFRPTPDDPGNQKPTTSSRQAVYSATYFYFKDLIRDGFVDNDQLRINFTLLPSVRLER